MGQELAETHDDPCADFIGHLLNLLMLGEEQSALPDGRRVLNRTRFSALGYNIELIQDLTPFDLKPQQVSAMKGGAYQTTRLIVRDAPLSAREEIIDLTNAIASLLSFASGSQVVMHEWEHCVSSQLGRSWSVVANFARFRPVFDLHNGKAVRRFLEMTIENYRRLSEERHLSVVVDYLVLPDALGLPLEMRLLAMFTLFENLKHSYAIQCGYPIKKDRFLRPPDFKNVWSFKDLLLDMLTSLGMTPDVGNIISVRNEIVHSGLCNLTFDQQWILYEKCQDIAREYLLRVLGFSGRFILFSRGTSEIECVSK